MSVTKTPARVKAEKAIYDLMDSFDPSKYNSDAYRKLFDEMSEADFKKYMSELYKEETYISFEADTASRKLTLEDIFTICEKRGFRTHKYVMYRDNKKEDGTCSVTPHPALILYIPVKRLQQMVSKKNSASGDIDKINPLVGTVTSDSKSAGINDTQTFGLIATGQKSTIKEFLGPRADDLKSKQQMLHRIEEFGTVSLKDLHIIPKNKQSIQTMIVFLRSVGIDVKVE